MYSKSVLIISTEFPPGPGGIGTHAYQLAYQLQKLNWRVLVFSEQDDSNKEEIDRFNQSQVFKVEQLLPIPSIYLLLTRLLRLVVFAIKYRPRYIIGTGKHGSWFAYTVARLTLRRCLLIGHGTEFSKSMSNRSKKINHWVYNHADKLIFVSKFTQNIAEKQGIFNKNTQVINNGADENVFKKARPEEILKFKTEHNLLNKKIILTVGNVTERKGQHVIIRAMPKICSVIPNVHYFILGLPTDIQKNLLLAKEIGMDNNIHFLGKKSNDELVMWMNVCDVFAMTSVFTYEGDFEGFGIAVIEAALCGKAAIVSDNSGLAEAVVNTETGLLVTQNDPSDTAEELIYLLNNEKLQSQLSANAYKRAVNYLTWEKVILTYANILNK